MCHFFACKTFFFSCKEKTKYRGRFKETLSPRRCRECAPNELGTPNSPELWWGKSIPKKGKRGGVEQDGAQAHGPLPPDSHRPPRFQTRCRGGRGANGRRKCLPPARPPSSHPGEKPEGQRVTAAPREKANRKCPFCSAQTLTPIPPTQPPSQAPRASAGGGARGCRGRPPPLPGPEPVHPKAPAPNRPKFTPGGARRLPGHFLAGLSRSPPGGRARTPRPARPVPRRARGRGVAKTPGGAWGSHFPAQRILPSRTPSVRGVTSSLLRETAPFATVSPRDTRSRAVNTFQEKLRTPHGAALPSVRRPRGAHTPPKQRSGEIPEPEPNP